MPKLQLTLACWNYDRTRALLEGRVTVDGVDLNYLNLPVEETFFRMLRHREFDVAEMSLSSYTLSLFRENPPFIAIPVFPSRYLPALVHLRQRRQRHSRAEGSDRQARRQSRISDDRAGLDSRHPERRVRRAGHQCTYLHRRRGRARPSGKDALSLPPDISGADSGHQDAFPNDRRRAKSTRFTRRARRRRSSAVRAACAGFFEDYRSVERDYYLKTRIFPIMHVVAPSRRLREEPLGGAVAVQSVRPRATRHLRGSARNGSAQVDASVAGTARRGHRKADGPRLLAVRSRTQHSSTTNFPPLFPRTRPGEAVVDAGRIIRAHSSSNEDTFSLQLIDSKEKLVSLQKADLEQVRIPEELRRCPPIAIN